MNRDEAKRILLLYRPWLEDSGDSEIGEALALAKKDPELEAWLTAHSANQLEWREQIRDLPVPEAGRERLLAERRTLALPRWYLQAKVWAGAAAAAVLILAGLAIRQMAPQVPDSFADYRNRMVRLVLREYRMDVVTNDMRQVRGFMADRGAPSDYSVPRGLGRLRLAGGGHLVWRSNPVAMVCFQRGDDAMLFLFVTESRLVRDPPSNQPQAKQVSKLQTVSWTEAGRTYVLAGLPEAGFAKKYL